MKILLVQPPKAAATIGGEDIFLYEPLALEYVAAGVAADHEVRILDLRLEAALAEALADFRPDIVGITAYTVHVATVRRLCAEVKRWNPHALTVVGGHHATVAPEDFLSPAIDIIVAGEGVFAFKEIVARAERRQGFAGVPGIAVQSGSGLAASPIEPAVDLDALPLPARRLTAGYRARYHSEWMKPLASIRTSKGCPFRCSFCALWKLTGGRYLRRQPERIIEELAGISEPFVFFADDESLLDGERMLALAALIREAGIRKRYFLYGRSDTIARNPDLLAAWRAIGLERVFVGLEFFRDEDLRSVAKDSTIADNERAVRILQDLDVEIYASFIVRPDFGREDFAAYRRYCRRLNLSFATFGVLTPLPGTDLHAATRSQFITDNYDLFDFVHTVLPTAMPLKDFYREYHRLLGRTVPLRRTLAFLRRFPAREIPSFIIRSRRVFDRVRTAYRDY